MYGTSGLGLGLGQLPPKKLFTEHQAGVNFLTAGLNVDLLFDGNEVLDVRLPSHVILEVTDTEPGFKGNTATGASKPATLETGYTLNVPLFIDENDKLRIDTRTGDYVERSKD